MVLHNDLAFTIYFGDLHDRCVKSNYTDICIQGFEKLKTDLNLENLIFLKQVHGIDGEVFTEKFQLTQLCSHPSIRFATQITQGEREKTVRGACQPKRLAFAKATAGQREGLEPVEPYERKKNIFPTKSDLILFQQNGDFLVTTLKNVGIGVLTADCLPVVFYDKVNSVAAVAHAGWRGAVAKINEKVIRTMQEKFGTKIADLNIFLGPCAKSCCYQVQDNFLENSEISKFSKDVIVKKDGNLFFDLPKLAQLQLLEFGIREKQIETSYNLCTICDSNFHSYRRDKENAGRQATIISIR